MGSLHHLKPTTEGRPLYRLIREGCWRLCDKCGSSVARKYWLFGKLRCIHPECGYEPEPKREFIGYQPSGPAIKDPAPPPRKP